jgi:hypothetical protein
MPVAEVVRQARTVLRASSPAQRALRMLLVLTGLAVFTLEPDRGGSLAGVCAWIVVLAIPFAAALPASDAPLGLLLAGCVSWVAGWGGHLPPVSGTVLLGAALYLHHLAATLAAATPSHATLDPSLLRRWSIPLLAGAIGLLGAALAAYRTDQLPLSPVLQFAGLAGVLATAGALVLLSRR